MKNIFKIAFIVFFAMVGISNSFADSIYSTHTILVDETADTAVIAKKNAFKKAKQQAWKNLLSGVALTQRDDLPDLSVSELRDIIQTIDVNGEKTRNNRYFAEISIYFNPYKVKRMFASKNITFVLERGVPVIVVPVYYKYGARKIYEQGNLWKDALDSNPKIGGLLPVLLAPGGAINSLKIDAGIIANRDKIISAANNYGTEGAVIAEVYIKPVAKGSVAVLKWYGVGGFLNDVSTELTEKISGGEQETMARIVYLFYASLEDQWRKKMAVNREAGDYTQTLLFSTENIEEWNILKQQIRNMESVENLDLKGIKGGVVKIDVTFLVNKERFKKLLERLGYVVQQGNELWAVSRR